MAYSHDLRKKALGYIENGGSQVQASRIFAVTIQTLCNWANRRKRGLLPPIKTRKRSPSKINNEALKKYLQKHPDAYLREIASEFDSSISGIFYACKRLKVSLKKRPRFTKKETIKKEKYLKKL